jgi:uncharacterized protein (TIGR02646 family)
LRTIIKGTEPPDLTTWKQRNPHKNYKDLDGTEEGKSIRATIRGDVLKEQFYLCAYCCQRIQDIDACRNEHIEAQSQNPTRTLDFSNIVASCKTLNQCDDAHKSQHLLLTPLMPECEIELRFKISGRVEGSSSRAIDTIKVLNLGDHEKNNRALIEKRKQLSDALLWINGIDPAKGLEDEDLLKILIDELSQPQQDRMEPFAPVVINILQNWLQS